MSERFAASFQVVPGGQVTGPLWCDDRLLAITGYRELARGFAGCSFENGVYRLHDARTGPPADALIAETFPQAASRAARLATTGWDASSLWTPHASTAVSH